MASKQLFRRLPLLAREGWSQVNAGALPEVANDVLGPIVSGSDPNNARPTSGPHAALAGSPLALQRHAPMPQTLGQWGQRLPHLQPLHKPLSTLGAGGVPRSAWPAVAAAAAAAKQQQQQLALVSPTNVAAATLPAAIAGLLKQQRPAQAVGPEAAATAFELGGQSATFAPVPPVQLAAPVAPAPTARLEAPAAAATAAVPVEPLPAAALAAAQPAPAPPLAAPTPQPQTRQPLHLQQPQPLPQPQQPQQPRRSGAGGRGSSSNPASVQLNKRISACASPQELLALVATRGHQLDYFNISTALAKLPKLAPEGAGGEGGADAASRAVLEHLARHMVARGLHSFDARGIANS
ncbi:hypothetical protein TSOC_004358, partial [Tetrabaena socialis]